VETGRLGHVGRLGRDLPGAAVHLARQFAQLQGVDGQVPRPLAQRGRERPRGVHVLLDSPAQPRPLGRIGTWPERFRRVRSISGACSISPGDRDRRVYCGHFGILERTWRPPGAWTADPMALRGATRHARDHG
jgi:hypothetical protein